MNDNSSGGITFTSLMANWPTHIHPVVRANQRTAFEFLPNHPQAIIELGTGEGKTEIQYTMLRAAQAARMHPLFLVVPNKPILYQTLGRFPGAFTPVLGRNEHPCFYYEEDEEKLTLETSVGQTTYRADEVPCSLLRDCPHRVDLKTGQTLEDGAAPCPYLWHTHQAMKAPIVLCTMAYYLFAQLFTKRWEQPELLVIDEAHRFADVVRNCLSYEITDYHLGRAVKLLERLGADESKVVDKFLKKMIHFVKRKPAHKPTLLEDRELIELVTILEEIDASALERKLTKAIKEGAIDAKDEVETLKKVETLVRNIARYIHSIEYSLEAGDRGRLNYTYSFYTDEKEDGKHVQYRLVIKSHYVAPLIKRILGTRTVAMSATIGNPDIFSWETGIRGDFLSIPASLPAKNARIYMPLDTPNLAMKARKPGDVKRWLRNIAKACTDLGKKKIRSLVVVVSNEERDLFMKVAAEEGLDAISYGNGVTARQAVEAFRDKGQGTTLVGTEANYGEGIDLPRQIAPVIFSWRPGYPPPDDPATKFEERRFGKQRWMLWNWRVSIRALQVRGRNLRGPEDLGVTIFISQQYRNFVFASLPQELRKYYDGDKSFSDSVTDAAVVALS